MIEDLILSESLLGRALAPPTRLAPLAALALELRRPGVWLAVCRAATEQQPGWLHQRMAVADPLVLAIGMAGDAQRDPVRARAVCGLALVFCGLADEGPALARAAEVTGEAPAPADLAALDAERMPLLADLVADLRAPRDLGRSARVRTVVSGKAGASAQIGSAVVSVLAGRAPGLRWDMSLRLFVDPDPHADDALVAVAAASDPSSMRCSSASRTTTAPRPPAMRAPRRSSRP